MATTPPPPSTIRIPPTPRHGSRYDQYEPYTRHSSRLASQRASRESHTTPPPNFPASHTKTSTRNAKKQSNNEFEALSPPGSTFGSPRKKQSGRSREGAAVTHSPDDPSAVDNSDPFNTTGPSNTQQPPLRTLRPTLTDGMLPTPAKTPRKKAIGDVGTTARTLFPTGPSLGLGRSKKAKKHTGFSLDSFDETTRGNSKIEIYTDTRDRIPEVDESESNPFYKNPVRVEASSNTTARASRRSRREEYKRDKEVDEAIEREDGMIYVFRGKRMFRKFTDETESDGEDENDDLGLLSARPDLMDSTLAASVRPLTRSSIKPRVLFPSSRDCSRLENNMNDTDEEAATDIEDHMVSTDVAEDVDHATDLEIQERPVTPPMKSTIETPSSPGATMRSLRPRPKRDMEHIETPTVSEARKRISPFDGWLRKKQTPAGTVPKAKKRDADSTGSPGGPAQKKTRGNRATASS